MMDGNDDPFYVEDERDGVMELYTLCSSEESVIHSGSQQLYLWKKSKCFGQEPRLHRRKKDNHKQVAASIISNNKNNNDLHLYRRLLLLNTEHK